MFFSFNSYELSHQIWKIPVFLGGMLATTIWILHLGCQPSPPPPHYASIHGLGVFSTPCLMTPEGLDNSSTPAENGVGRRVKPLKTIKNLVIFRVYANLPIWVTGHRRKQSDSVESSNPKSKWRSRSPVVSGPFLSPESGRTKNDGKIHHAING